MQRARLCRVEAPLLAALCLVSACVQHPHVVIHAARGPVRVDVEVADTPDTRSRGLMYRSDLAPNAGMLFVFSAAAEQRFWMKNTPLPLDMIFIGSDRTVVGIVPDTHPFTTNPLGVSAPSLYVLEVHAGFSAAHGVAAGDAVELVGVVNSS